MKSLKNKFFIGLSAVTMTVSAGVYAQSPGSGMGGSDMREMHGMYDMHSSNSTDRAKISERIQQRMAKHQAELHAKLKLTAAQEPAWKTFTETTATGAMPAPPDRKEMEKLTTPERMEKMLERAKEHQTKMQEHLASLKTFYAVLTPEQQKIFDDSHRNLGRQGMQHRRTHDSAKMDK